MGCKDPVVERLNKLRYNMVKLPRAGIEPLDVLGRESDTLNRLGSIVEIWTSSEPPPVAGAPQAAAGIEGQKTGDLDLGIGLKLLSNALAGLGSAVGLPSLSAGFQKTKKLQFRFMNVESVSVTPFALGKYLAAGTLDLSNPFVSHYFDNDETQEYILFEVLKSRSVSITSKDERGVKVDADVSVLQPAMTASVKLKASGGSASEIVFEGESAVTFAFKAYEVSYEGNRWLLKGAPPEEGLSFGAGEEEPGVVLSPGRGMRVGR